MDQQPGNEQTQYEQPQSSEQQEVGQDGGLQPTELGGAALQGDEGRFDYTKAETVGRAINERIDTPHDIGGLNVRESLAASRLYQVSLDQLKENRHSTELLWRPNEERKQELLESVAREEGEVTTHDGEIATLKAELEDDGILVKNLKEKWHLSDNDVSDDDIVAYRDDITRELTTLEGEREYARRRLEQAKRDVEAYIDGYEQGTRGSAIESKNATQASLNHMANPLVKLYDLNPERFANLPTSEFMELSKKYVQLENELRSYEESLEWAKDTADAARDAAKFDTDEDFRQEDEWYVDRANAIHNLATTGNPSDRGGPDRFRTIVKDPEDSKYVLRDTILPALGATEVYKIRQLIDDPAVNSRFVEAATLISTNRIDRTPRQNIETLTTFIESLGADIEPKLEEAKQKLEAFKTENNPQPPVNNQTNEEAGS